jgi:hypothetical protein
MKSSAELRKTRVHPRDAVRQYRFLRWSQEHEVTGAFDLTSLLSSCNRKASQAAVGCRYRDD